MSFSSSSTRDISVEALAILKVVEGLEGIYGINYITRVLRADDVTAIRKKSHLAMDAFGSLDGLHTDRIQNIMFCLIDEGFLVINDEQYGSIGIGESGITFLKNPSTLLIGVQHLERSPGDRRLISNLRQLRFHFSEEEGKPPFRIFTDYTLQRLVREKPQTVAELKSIPGFGDYRADTFGKAVLASIRQSQRENGDSDRGDPHSGTLSGGDADEEIEDFRYFQGLVHNKSALFIANQLNKAKLYVAKYRRQDDQISWSPQA